jgi:hypothetical protein
VDALGLLRHPLSRRPHLRRGALELREQRGIERREIVAQSSSSSPRNRRRRASPAITDGAVGSSASVRRTDSARGEDVLDPECELREGDSTLGVDERAEMRGTNGVDGASTRARSSMSSAW